MTNAKVNDIISDFAKNIADEIALKRFYELEEVKAIAKTRLSFALQEILNASVSDLEQEVTRLKEIYGTATGRLKFETGAKLGVAKDNLKKYRMAQRKQRENDPYTRLKNYVRGKYGADSLNDFFQNVNPV